MGKTEEIGLLVQMARTPPWQGGGRRFESCRVHHKLHILLKMGRSSNGRISPRQGENASSTLVRVHHVRKSRQMKPKYQEYAERSTRKKMVLMPGFREGDVLTVKAESRENGLQVGWTVMVAEDQTDSGWVRVWFGGRQYTHATHALEIWNSKR